VGQPRSFYFISSVWVSTPLGICDTGIPLQNLDAPLSAGIIVMDMPLSAYVEVGLCAQVIQVVVPPLSTQAFGSKGVLPFKWL